MGGFDFFGKVLREIILSVVCKLPFGDSIFGKRQKEEGEGTSPLFLIRFASAHERERKKERGREEISR